MPLPVMDDEPTNPSDINVASPRAVVPEPNMFADLVEELRREPDI
jgi:hypothetical protein